MCSQDLTKHLFYSPVTTLEMYEKITVFFYILMVKKRNFTAFYEHFGTCALNLNHSQRNRYHKVFYTFKNMYILLLVLSSEAKGKKISQNGKCSHPLSLLLSWYNNYAKSNNGKIQGFVECNREDFDKDLLISRFNKRKLSSWALFQSRATFLDGAQAPSRVMSTCPFDMHF